MKQKKKTKIREGSIAWHVKKNWFEWLVILAAVVMCVMFALTVNAADGQTNTQPQTEKPSQANFETYTAQSVEEMICIECDKYGIDPALPIAIAKLETGNFTSDAFAELNNVGGLSHDEEPIGFPTLERGVEAFVMNLHHNYYEKGLNTPEKMAEKYCPLNSESWAELVTKIMNE